MEGKRGGWEQAVILVGAFALTSCTDKGGVMGWEAAKAQLTASPTPAVSPETAGKKGVETTQAVITTGGLTGAAVNSAKDGSGVLREKDAWSPNQPLPDLRRQPSSLPPDSERREMSREEYERQVPIDGGIISVGSLTSGRVADRKQEVLTFTEITTFANGSQALTRKEADGSIVTETVLNARNFQLFGYTREEFIDTDGVSRTKFTPVR